MTLRATTNLVVPPTLQLDKVAMKRDFMYVYNRGFRELPAAFMTKLWACVLFPKIAQNSSFGTNKRDVREFSTQFNKDVPAALTKLRKINDANDPHFEVSVPLWSFDPMHFSSLEYVLTHFVRTPGTDEEEDYEAHPIETQIKDHIKTAPESVNSIKFPASRVLSAFPNLSPVGTESLKNTLLGVYIEHADTTATIFATFKINQAEAEQLTTTPWLEIRNIDLYPILMQWVATVFGTIGNNPTASFPVSKIARTLPAVQEGDARVNAEGLSIGPDGIAYYLPEKLDNTVRYEDLFSQAGANDDGSFALAVVKHVATEMEMTAPSTIKGLGKLPRNIPVLIDWVNYKYSYTTTNGLLKVQDLVRYKKAEVTHIANILRNTDLSIKLIGQFASLAEVGGITSKLELQADDLKDTDTFDPNSADLLKQAAGDIRAYYEAVLSVVERQYEDPILKLRDFSPTSEYKPLRPIARWIAKAHDAIVNHLDAVYHKYSVSHTSVTLALITLIAKYASQYDEVLAKDNQARTAALNQSVQEDWEPPSIPLLSPKVGLLPHQKKVRNLLKDSPDFAILPIQAGGGKSPMTITDILYEIKADRSQPYLILCPPHLVAQYIKEIVFFTDGKLNAIAVNTYTIRKNGLKRLGKILESAPRNSVVVCDYDVLRYRQQQVCYGTSNINVYPIIEFLRQFKFQYAMLDESHSVKNDSARTKACMALIADIPKKRLASGTMAHDSPSDLAMQIAMLDPTLFGTKTNFNETFGAKVRGDRVMEWKPGAQQQIMSIIKSRIVVAGAMRKEWAALLPKANEVFHRVDLSEAQRDCYNVMFMETMEKIRKAAETNPRLAEFVNGGKDPKKETESEVSDEDAMDEFADEDLAGMLNPYLARLEQFITAPASDELGVKMLHGEDLISPKVRMIHKIIKKHLDANIPGKILVFTNYTASAEEIFNKLPEDIKAKSILYIASDKIEAGAQFENDESKQVMIGVEQSMNTGLNLQFASRLIRVETVWNPGTLEQGNSRVNRPELKKESRRKEIYFDWVMADRTIDITKISRLISKLVANAKFENTDNPAYEGIEDVPVMKMTLDTVEKFNDWGDPENPASGSTLAKYGNAYRDFKQIQADDYAEYRAKHGELRLEPCVVAATPKDARLMHTVPYTPGLEIYGQDQLGLVRIDDFLRLDSIADDEDTDTDEDTGNKEGEAEQRKRQAELLVGQICHTEFGEGVIRGVNFINRFVTVDFPSGFSKMKFASTFIITRKDTSTKDIRNQILKGIGDMEVDAPIDSPVESIVQDAKSVRIQKKRELEDLKKKKEKEKKKQSSMSVELNLSVTNGFLSLSYFVDEKNAAASNALQAFGFRPSPQFYYAEVNNALRLDKQMRLWKDKGFTIDKQLSKELLPAFTNFYDLLKSGKVRSHNATYKFASSSQLKNFYRMEYKPNADATVIKPYPLVELGSAYIVLPIRGQAGTKAAMRHKAAGIRWTLSDPTLVCYGLTILKVAEIVRKVKDSGIQIANEKELKSEFLKLRKLKVRDAEEE